MTPSLLLPAAGRTPNGLLHPSGNRLHSGTNMSAGLPQHLTLDYRAPCYPGRGEGCRHGGGQNGLEEMGHGRTADRQGGNPLFRFRPLCFRRNAAAAGNSRPAAGLRG